MKKISTIFSFLVFGVLMLHSAIVAGECVVTIGASPSATVCAGTNVTLTANPSGGTGSYSFVWSTAATTASIVVSTGGTYSVTVTDGAAVPCVATAQIAVTVNALPSATVGSNRAICAGVSTTLGATAIIGNTYSWTSSPAGFASTQSNPGVSPMVTTTYTLTEIKTATGCQASNSVTITVNPLPAAVSGPATAICLGKSAQLGTTAVVGNTYSWSSVPVGFYSLTSNPVVSPIVNTTYTLVETVTSTGCTKSNSAAVTVNPMPDKNFTFSPNNVCASTAINFSASGSNLNYVWSFSDPGSGVNNASTLKSPSHVFAAYGNATQVFPVKLVVSTSLGCKDSLVQNVTVIQKPDATLIDITGQGFVHCANSPETFDLAVSYSPAITTNNTNYFIDWGDSSPTWSSNSPPTALTHPYLLVGFFNLTFTVTGQNGCTNSRVYNVFNGSNPAISLGNPGGTSGCVPITFTFPLDGWQSNTPSTFYTINFGDNTPVDTLYAPLPASVSHQYTEPSCNQPNRQYVFTVKAINSCLTTSGTIDGIQLSKKPNAYFTHSPAIGCVNTLMTFTNLSTNGCYISGPNVITATKFTWNFGDGSPPLVIYNVASGNITSVGSATHTYVNPGIYNVSLTANNGCGDSIYTHPVCINPQPISTFTLNKTTDCVPFTVIATNTSPTPNTCGDRVYTWSVTKNGSPQCMPSSQNYTLTVNGDNATIVFQDPGDYSINLNVKNSCSPSGINSSQNIIAKSVPRVTLANIADMCQNGTVTPLPSYQSCYDPITEYLWTFNGITPGTSTVPFPTNILYNSPGTFTIKVKAKNVCGWSSPETTSNSFMVKPLPTATAGSTQTICKGGSVTLAGQVGGSATGGTWTSNAGGTFSPSATSLTATWTPTSTYTGTATLTLTTTGMSPCAAVTSTVEIVVRPTPTASAGTAQTICQGGSSVLAGTVGGSASGGTWTTSAGGTFSPNANTLNATWTPPAGYSGTAVLTLTSIGMSPCAAVTSTVNIIVRPTPTVNAGTTPSICQGGSVVLGGSVGGSATGGTWTTPAGGTFSPNVNTLNATWTPPAGYFGTAVVALTTTGMSPCGAVTSNVNINVESRPIIIGQPTVSQSLCVGGSIPAPLGVTVSGGTGTTSYQWYSNTTSSTTGGTVISGATNSTYQPVTFSTTGTYYYYAVVSQSGNNCGNAVSNVAAVTVVADPTLTVQPLSTQTSCQNAVAATLSVTASGGTGTFSYQWYSNTVNSTSGSTLLTGVTNASYVPPTTLVGTKYYYCVISQTGPGCQVASNISTVIVNPGPTFTTQPSPSTVCVGGIPTLLNVAYTNGAGNPSYQWYSNAINNNTTGILLTGATNSTYQSPSTTAGTTYYYCVISLATGGCTSLTSNTAQIVINPDPTISVQPISTQSLCMGGTLPLPLSISYTGGTGTATYQWYSNTSPVNSGGTILPGATNSSYLPGVFNAVGTYYYYAAISLSGNGCGNESSNVAAVVVVSDPVITAQPLASQSLCQSAAAAALSVTLTGGTGTFYYQWYFNTVNSVSGGTLIAGASNSSYQPLAVLAGTTYYYCIISLTAGGCSSISSNIAQVVVHPLPLAYNVTGGGEFCSGGAGVQVGLSGGQVGVSYQLFLSGTAVSAPISGTGLPISFGLQTAPGVYSVRATNGLTACSNFMNGTATVAVNPLPITDAGMEKTIPFGTSTVLNGIASGGTGTLGYSWSPISNIATGNTSLTPTTTNLYMNTMFTLTVTDSKGCSTSDQTLVAVSGPLLSVACSGSPANSICTGSSVQLSATASGGSGSYNYSWSSNPAGSPPWSSTLQNPVVAPLVSTTYTVVANDGFGQASCNMTITVNPIPVMATFPLYQVICSGSNAYIILSSNVAGTSFNWTSSVVSGNIFGNSASGVSTGYIGDVLVNTGYTTGTVRYVITPVANGCPGVPVNYDVYVKPVPWIMATPGEQTICSGGTTQAIQISSTLSGTAYFWTTTSTPGVTGAVATGTTNPVPAMTLHNSATTTGTVTITITPSASGCSGSPLTYQITVNPDVLPTISGIENVCEGDSMEIYQTEPGMTGYAWTVSSGGIMLSPGNDSAVMIHWQTAGLHTVGVSYINGNGCTASAPTIKPVTVNPIPAPMIIGSTIACSGNLEAYYTESGNTAYTWDVSSGGIIVSGGNTHLIQVLWTTPGTQSISVSYTSPAGCQAVMPGMWEVSVIELSNPVINGPTTVCPGNSNVTYSTEPGMSAYLWSISPGGTIISGSGTNTITVIWNTPGIQQIFVNYPNIYGCMAVSPTVFDVTVTGPPAVAGIVSGLHEVCVSTQAVPYSVAPATGATSYNWSLPFGVTMASGAGTNSILVNFPGYQISGNIKVAGVNACFTGATSPNFPVKTNSQLTGQVTLNNMTIINGQEECLSVQRIILGGEGTPFIVDAGGHVKLIASENILFLPGTKVNTGGFLNALITSVCIPCNAFKSNTGNPVITEAVQPIEMQSSVNKNSLFVVYPNPTDGRFTIEPVQIEGTSAFSAEIQIYDAMGNWIKVEKMPEFTRREISLEERPAGVYILQVKVDDQIETARVIKIQ